MRTVTVQYCYIMCPLDDLSNIMFFQLQWKNNDPEKLHKMNRKESRQDQGRAARPGAQLLIGTNSFPHMKFYIKIKHVGANFRVRNNL